MLQPNRFPRRFSWRGLKIDIKTNLVALSAVPIHEVDAVMPFQLIRKPGVWKESTPKRLLELFEIIFKTIFYLVNLGLNFVVRLVFAFSREKFVGWKGGQVRI